MVRDTFSVHIVSYPEPTVSCSFGMKPGGAQNNTWRPTAFITTRLAGSERHGPKVSFCDANAGVLGRIFSRLRLELLQMIIDERINVGRLDDRLDSPCIIAGDLITRTTNFTGDSLDSLENWLEQLEEDFDHNISLAKYGFHIKVASKLALEVEGV